MAISRGDALLAVNRCARKFGSRDSAVVRALALQQCDLGSIPTRCHIWVEFFAGSHLVSRVFFLFSGFPVHLPPQKTTSKLKFDRAKGPAQPAKTDVASSANTSIYSKRSSN